ncbi:MAG: SRPBCC family protein [Alphaproteobacteria bacterium]|nr:SRPBCC family protein [Alphaproteobacteria bacterium]
MPTPSPVAIAVQKISASPERVYDAILDPDMIARFMFGPLLREEEILHIRNDPRVGATFSYKVRRLNQTGGSDDIDHVGTYLELVRPTRIVFTWAIAPDTNGSTVAIDIAPTADGCTITLTHEMAPEWATFIDRARTSWEKMLGVLSNLLA